MRHSFDTELRGQSVTVDVTILPPEPDVGLIGYGFEDEVVTDEDGDDLDWELTDDERARIGQFVADYGDDGCT